MNNINRINHKTLNSILKQLKADIEIAKAKFITSNSYKTDEMQVLRDCKSFSEISTLQGKLKQLRECKLSDLHMIIKQGELI